MKNERIEQRPMRARPARVIVKFDQQQRKLLDFLRAEGKFGARMARSSATSCSIISSKQQKRSKR